MHFVGPFDNDSEIRAIIDSAPVPIWVSGPDGKAIYFNKAWLKFTGRTVDEELGEGWTTQVHSDDHPALAKGVEASTKRQPFWTEFRLRRHDGVNRWLLDSASPRFTSD